MKVWGQEETKRLKEVALEVYNINKLCEMFQVGEPALRTKLHSMGIKINTRNKFTQDQIDTAIKLWATGNSSRTIAKTIGSTKNIVDGYISLHRDKFPKRVDPRQAASYNSGKKIFQPRAEIEEPPMFIAVPENAKHTPWIDLLFNECQWGISNDFWEPVSNTFKCCGLPVEGGSGIRARFCCYHVDKALKK